MLNKIILVGRLTDAPEVVKLKEGQIVKFSLAFNTGKESTDFVDCQVREHLHEVVTNNLDKGDKIAITGIFRVQSYTTKDGQSRKKALIYVDDIEFIDVLKFATEPVKEEPVEENKKPQRPTRR